MTLRDILETVRRVEIRTNRLVNDMKSVRLHPRDLKLLPEGSGWLLIEFGGESKKESDSKARKAIAALLCPGLTSKTSAMRS